MDANNAHQYFNLAMTLPKARKGEALCALYNTLQDDVFGDPATAALLNEVMKALKHWLETWHMSADGDLIIAVSETIDTYCFDDDEVCDLAYCYAWPYGPY
jgi:hypothetical protein